MQKDKSEPLLLRIIAFPVLFKKEQLSLLKRTQSVFQEKNPLSAMFVLSFMGARFGELGAIIITPYLKHPRLEVRYGTVAALSHSRSLLRLAKLKKFLHSDSSPMRHLAAGTIVAVATRDRNKLKSFHQQAKQSPADIRSGAAFGYYLQVHDKLYRAIFIHGLDLGLIKKYDILDYGYITNFVYQTYYVNGFKEVIKSPDVAETLSVVPLTSD